MILRRTTTVLWIEGRACARANVWTENGHSSKTFATASEADRWVFDLLVINMIAGAA